MNKEVTDLDYKYEYTRLKETMNDLLSLCLTKGKDYDVNAGNEFKNGYALAHLNMLITIKGLSGEM